MLLIRCVLDASNSYLCITRPYNRVRRGMTGWRCRMTRRFYQGNLMEMEIMEGEGSINVRCLVRPVRLSALSAFDINDV